MTEATTPLTRAVRSMVLRGLGIMRMGSPLAGADIRNGLVIPVLENYECLNPQGSSLSVWVVHSVKKRPLRLQLFTDFSVQYLRKSVSVKEFEGDLSIYSEI